MKLTFNLVTDTGQDVDAMRKVIEARSRELGFTTKESCIALVINVLRSIRADTKAANPREKADISISNADSRYTPSWKRAGQHSKRVLRCGANGCEVKPSKVVWRCPKYRKGEEIHSYEVTDRIGDGKTLVYILVCEDEKKASQYAKAFHKAQIMRGRNLARFVLGMAMHKVHSQENPATGEIAEEAKRTGLRNVKASVSEQGFNSGNVHVSVSDELEYATCALRHGEGYVNTALQKALNKMTGYINHRLKDKGIGETLKIPYEELKRA